MLIGYALVTMFIENTQEPYVDVFTIIVVVILARYTYSRKFTSIIYIMIDAYSKFVVQFIFSRCCLL